MKTTPPALRLAALGICAALAWPLAAQAQNLAIVNGKAVPQARVDALLDQVKPHECHGVLCCRPSLLCHQPGTVAMVVVIIYAVVVAPVLEAAAGSFGYVYKY